MFYVFHLVKFFKLISFKQLNQLLGCADNAGGHLVYRIVVPP